MIEQVINNEELLKEWVPSRTPLRWFLINQCLLFYSMIQFSIIIMTVLVRNNPSLIKYQTKRINRKLLLPIPPIKLKLKIIDSV